MVFASMCLATALAFVPPADYAGTFKVLPSGAMQKYGLSPTRPRLAPRSATLSLEAPKGVTQAPPATGLQWAVIDVGDACGIDALRIALDESTPEQPRLWADTDGDGDLIEHGPLPWGPGSVLGAPPSDKCRMTEVRLGKDSAAPDAVAMVLYRFTAAEAQARMLPADRIFFYADFCMEGEVSIGGRKHKAALLDQSSCGQFAYPDGPNKYILVCIDVNDDGKIEDAEVMPVEKPMRSGETEVVVERIAADGATLEFRKVEAPAKAVRRTPGGNTPKDGDKAPSFTSPALDGAPVQFPEDYKGKIVLVDFWATWCGPCVAEIPNVVKAHDRFKDKGFEVLGISFDRAGQSDMLRSFIKQRKMPWRQAYEGKFWNTEIGGQWGVRSIPQMFLIDGDTGKILASNSTLRGGGLERAVEKALEARAKAAK